MNIFTTAYSDVVDATVLSRLAELDNILGSDSFLIGLSEHADLNKLEDNYLVVSDVVLGLQFFSSLKKPRKHKGDFSVFGDTFSLIDHIARCIGSESQAYMKSDDTDYEVNKRTGVLAELDSFLHSRIENLGLAKSWSSRPEFGKSSDKAKVEQSVNLLADMLYGYFFYLRRFAHIADFNDISLCKLFIEQLQAGGVPCGWLSKSPYWDLSNLETYDDYNPRSYPKLHHGVFNDPTDKLAMLYLD